jgi:hypothetical protein
MSKMSNLMIEIKEMLQDGHEPKMVAALLNCHIHMVYDTIEMLDLEVVS